jgi:hypothetical protein
MSRNDELQVLCVIYSFVYPWKGTPPSMATELVGRVESAMMMQLRSLEHA